MFKKALSAFVAVALVLIAIPFATVQVEAATVNVMLDPGHGATASSDGSTGTGSDGAVQWGGVNEYIYNWQIACATRDRLSQYNNVNVYMTKTNAETTPGLGERVDMAVANGCQAFISIHNNAGGGKGSLVFVPNSNYRPQFATDSTACANKILDRLVSDVGQVRNNWDNGVPTKDSTSVTYPDGTAADYYQLIRKSKLNGLDIGMIVECVFLDTQSEYNKFLANTAMIEAMGVAIADGIADYYGLSMGPNYVNTVDTSSTTSVSAITSTVEYSKTVTQGDALNVNGWSIHDSGISSYRYSMDGTNWTTVAGTYRADVAAANPSYTNCTDINAFNFNIDTSTLKSGKYTVQVQGVTKASEIYDIAKMSLTVLLNQQYIEGDVTMDRETETGATYISDVALDTTADELLAKFTKDGCQITDAKGKTVTGKLATGYIVKLYINGELHETATIIVKGDLNGDGIATSKDVLAAKMYANAVLTANTVKLASDMNSDGMVTVSDMSAIAQAAK